MIFLNRLRLRQWALLIAALLAIGALFLLARASSNNSSFQGFYWLLYPLNIVLILGLMIWVGQQLVQLWLARKRGVFGSKLAVRLMLMCSLIALLPGVLVYASSVYFLGYSIESWFDVRVDRALEGALDVSISVIASGKEGTLNKAIQIAGALEDTTTSFTSGPGPALAAATANYSVQEAALFSADGVQIAVAGDLPSLAPNTSEALSRDQLAEMHALAERRFPQRFVPQALRERSKVEEVRSFSDIRFIALVPVTLRVANRHESLYFLRVIDAMSTDLFADITTVERGRNDYRTLSSFRKDLRRGYTWTLTMALLTTLTVAVGWAIMFSERFAAPLGSLAQGTRAVAEGDFSVRQPVASADEMGSLTESFNAMTIQLEQARQEREHNHRILETTRAYLESILSNLSSGVMVFDEHRRLRMVNQSASVILQTPLLELIGVPLSEWRWKAPELSAFVDILLTRLEMGEVGQWHQEANVPVHEVTRSLLIHGTRITGTPLNDVIVVDDVTVVVQAQRDTAWSEVARRLAHEIKNPLTPIQLSAERLAAKLNDKLDSEDKAFLNRGIQTIVSQVGAMKHMVDDFAVYAKKTNASQLVRMDVRELLTEVIALYEHLRPNLHLNMPETPVVLEIEPDRMRQVINNLLKNAIEAQADIADPLYDITVAVLPNEITIDFADNGPGFQDEILNRAFEPYVTTKAKGTGLGLAIVKNIIEEHDGHVTIRNRAPAGCIITLTLPIHRPISSNIV